MNKKMLRNVMIVAVVILLLIVGIIFLNKMDNSDNTTDSTALPQYTIYSIDLDKVQSVSAISAAAQEIIVNRVGNAWAVNGISEDVDQSKLASFVSTAITVLSQNQVELNAQDLAQYGLEEPDLTISVTARDGVSETLLIGDKSPTLGEYFIRKQDSRDVYTLSGYKVDTLTKPISYYYQFNRFSVNTADITNITIERKEKDTLELRLKDNLNHERYNTVWELLQPYPERYNAIDDAVDDMILNPLSELTVTNPAPENVDYGFESPCAVMTIVSEEYKQDGTRAAPQTTSLVIGNSDGGVTYVQLNGKAYSVSANSIEFIHTDAFLLVSKLAGFVDILDTDGVLVQYNGSEMNMQIDHHKNEDQFVVNEKQADTDSARELYQSMIGLSVDALYQGETLGGSRLVMDYHGFNGAENVNITISSLNEVYDAVTRNGVTRFVIKKSKTDELIHTISDYVNHR